MDRPGAFATVSLAAAAPAEADPPLTAEQEQDIQWLRSILRNPAGEPNIRAGAAIRLANMNLPQADAVLADALRSGEAAVMLAVVEAMQAGAGPVDVLLEPAVNALAAAPDELLDPLALALARYADGSLQLVAERASDMQAPVAERLGPIHALGTFRSRAAAVELMNLLDVSRDEPQEVVLAVCAALRRGTGLPHDDDADQWRRWWATAKDQPREEWMSKMVQRLSEQLAAAQQQIRQEREEAQRTERRLAEAYRDLFATLSFDNQLAALPPLLDDPLASVRGFALDRIARLLRDSVRIGEDLQHKLAARLGDPVPALRLQAAGLLDQLNYEPTARLLAESLARETSPEVVGPILDILARRPLPESLAPVTPWLNDAALGERAANVVWEVTLLNRDLSEVPLDSLREALRRGSSPAHARVLARLGDDADVERLIDELDSGDDLMRERIAEGFARRGLRQPLLDRAHVSVIYPHALRVVADGPADLASLRQLIAMTPAQVNHQLWADAIEQLARRLSPQWLLQADDMLSSVSSAGPSLRISILQRAVNLPVDAMDPIRRGELAERLARLLLDVNQPMQAHQVLESVNGDGPSLRRLRFEAAVLAGQFDAAAHLDNGPEPWVELLTRMAAVNPEAAAKIHDEIIRRFDGQLGNDLTTELDAVRQQLREQMSIHESPA